MRACWLEYRRLRKKNMLSPRLLIFLRLCHRITREEYLNVILLEKDKEQFSKFKDTKISKTDNKLSCSVKETNIINYVMLA